MNSYSEKKEIFITTLFVAILFLMLIGMAAPSVLRRLGFQEADVASCESAAQEPDETTEPVNFAEAYPFDADGQETSDSTLYEKAKSIETTLKEQISNIETAANEQVPGRTRFIEAYIQIQNFLGSRVVNGDDVVVKMNNGLLTFLSDRLTEEEEDICISNLEGLAEFSESIGADFLYVQTPNKVNKYDNELPDGVYDYANENADRLTEALREDGISVLDLRDEIVKDMDFDSAFYASDHHWKPRTGLWAAQKILSTVNGTFGTNFNADACAQDAYEEKIYPLSFLGALGKKTGIGYVPLDDFSLLTPTFETDFTMKITGSGEIYKGDFEHAFIDKSQLSADDRDDYYTKNPYAAYFRDDQALVEVTNYKTSGLPKILFLKDSFGLTTAPFLATAAGEMDVVDLRHFNGSLEKYMEETKPDLVIVMYNPKAITAPAGYHADLFDFQ